jgi:hypothetical protein
MTTSKYKILAEFRILTFAFELAAIAVANVKSTRLEPTKAVFPRNGASLNSPQGRQACCISENRPGSRPKQAAEFDLIFSLLPVEITGLAL